MAKFAPDLENVFTLALVEAQRTHSRVLGTPHLFIGLTKLDGVTASGLRASQDEGEPALNSGRIEFVSADAELFQDSVKRAFGNVAGVIGDDSGEVGSGVGPDLVTALALPFELAAQSAQRARQLLIRHADTIKETRRGVVTGLS